MQYGHDKQVTAESVARICGELRLLERVAAINVRSFGIIIFFLFLINIEAKSQSYLNSQQKEDSILFYFNKLKLQRREMLLNVSFHPRHCYKSNCPDCLTWTYPIFLKNYYEIYKFYNDSILNSCYYIYNFSSKDYLNFVNIGVRKADTTIIYTITSQGRKFEKMMFYCLSKWIKRMKLKGLDFLIVKNQSPFDGSSIIFKTH